MSAPPRKYPRVIPHKTPSKTKQPDCFPTPRETSDSEESVKSTATNASDCNGIETGSCGSGDLTIVAEFDDLMRLMRQQCFDDIHDEYQSLAEQTRSINMQWRIAIQECKRLQAELEKKTQDYNDLEHRLGTARKLLDQERKASRKVKEERDTLEAKISKASDLLFNVNRMRLPDETRQQLAFLNSTRNQNGFELNKMAYGMMQHPDLSAIHEGHTTGSLLSDLSCSQSEDGLDTTLPYHTFKHNHAIIDTADEPASKRRRSQGSKYFEIGASDKVRATTTLTVTKDGPITATSIIESIPPEGLAPSAPPEYLDHDRFKKGTPRSYNNNNNNIRQHSLQAKTIMMPEVCNACGKRITFSKTAYKCKDCRSISHAECCDNLPLPCIPSVNTPTQRGLFGIIADYAPPISPMVPALIVHCIKEIESRGLTELGLYRVPGSERDVKLLKERFLRGKGAPSLTQTDTHVLCGTVKDFLRSLQEPLLTHKRWRDFVRAVEAKDEADTAPVLYQLVSELPQPNRDTLALLILHLKRISDSPECKMPVSNLATVFGPTIVGYSSADLDHASLLQETPLQSKVMEYLINLPSDYWATFVNVSNLQTPISKLHQTPSTDSLLSSVHTKNNILTPTFSARSARKKKQRFFHMDSPY